MRTSGIGKFLDNIKNFINRNKDVSDLDMLEKQLEVAISNGTVQPLTDEPVVMKSRMRKRPKSKLDVRTDTQDKDISMAWLGYNFIKGIAKSADEAPDYGDPARDEYLDRLWKKESILAGAMYSMIAKMVALTWQVTGPKRAAAKYANVLAMSAHMGGYDWGGFQGSTANDFYSKDKGVFWEVAREGNSQYGKLAMLGHIDSLACTLTGNRKRPVIYNSRVTSQEIRFKDGEYIHFTSTPSPREEHLGIGFCAVSRALRAAQLLVGLHDYDEQKLSNLPPEGVAAVTGLTVQEFQDALKLWKSQREQKGSLTFPQVLWLMGSQPNVKVSLDFIGFSQMPESFDRSTVVEQYINTLALTFGVDVREFWPVSTSSLGTAAESEIQHEKAKGKGPGEFISESERHTNGELPDGVDFAYDTQDIDEDIKSATIAQQFIGAYLPLVQPTQEGAEQLLSKENFLRLLADKNILPDYMVDDTRIAVEDSEIHIKEYDEYPDDFACFKWQNGYVRQVRPPAILMGSRSAWKRQEVPVAERLKGGPGSGHHGHAGRPGKVGGSSPGVGGSLGLENVVVALEDLSYDKFLHSMNKFLFIENNVEKLASSFGFDIDVKVQSASQFVASVNVGAKQLNINPGSIKGYYKSMFNVMGFPESGVEDAVSSPNNYKSFLNVVFHELGHAYRTNILGASSNGAKSMEEYRISNSENFANKFSLLLVRAWASANGKLISGDLAKINIVDYLNEKIPGGT